ncbi:hypothetical protein IVB40_28130 [Bradyrhizobium sp. 40]|uniref:hypothetical protein n=1 Tax=Bradyrhizobium sp. 40 TaxID=2782674 RepID=UPI00200016B5|nr:hypothetical protein [Bradyrhizobium sp. 40]UPJ41123.1 hypothetical protein IVB40_28130 [Bradyrhizobium sp. 40]
MLDRTEQSDEPTSRQRRIGDHLLAFVFFGAAGLAMIAWIVALGWVGFRLILWIIS